MKNYLVLILLLVAQTFQAQVKGNKEIVTQNLPAENLEVLEISLYANIEIDLEKEAGIRITADSNLIGLIDFEIVDGTLKLEQKKWIQPSEKIVIRIGAPQLKRVQLGTNDKVKVVNINRERFNALVLNGTMVLQGQVKQFNLGIENGITNASQLENETTDLNIWGFGKAILNTSEQLNAQLGDEARLELLTQPKKVIGSVAGALNRDKKRIATPRYISFKIRNNSKNRHDFFVIGPKPDGNNFSYGFPMPPGKTRKEKWTTGTQIFRVGKLGFRKKLRTITASDENTTVDLFDE